MNDDEARLRARLHEYAEGIEPERDVPAAGRARYRRLVWRRRATAVLGSAVAVIAVAGIGVGVARRPGHTLGVQTGGHSSTTVATGVPSTTAVATTAAPGPIVTGEPLLDTTWISNDEGWALVTADLVHTTDGGSTWRSVSQLPDIKAPTDGVDSNACAAVACVNHIRFADPLHGYLFGRAFLTTDDGGVTWTRRPSDSVVALEVARGRVFRVVSAHGCIAPGCTYFVETATVGSNSWTRLATPSLIGDAAQLLYDGPRIYVAVYGNPAGGASDAHIQLIRSLDSGKTWQRRSDPCGFVGTEEFDTESLAAAPGGFIVALCQPRLYDRPATVRTSSDAGSTFAAPQTLRLPSGAMVGKIAAGSATSIVVTVMVNAKQFVWVSHASGAAASWHSTLQVSSSDATPSVVFLGFEDAQTGRVGFSPDELWTTRDGGESWTSSRP
jgi:photosystem II stability/assembly factor-like uncharacterized protein